MSDQVMQDGKWIGADVAREQELQRLEEENAALKAENQAAWEAVTKFCEASCVHAISSYVLAARASAEPDSAKRGCPASPKWLEVAGEVVCTDRASAEKEQS